MDFVPVRNRPNKSPKRFAYRVDGRGAASGPSAPFEVRKDGAVDMPWGVAADRFRDVTGIDVRTDLQLHALMSAVRLGCDENAMPAGERTELREGQGDFVRVRIPTRKGRPQRPRNLTRSLAALTSWLTPAHAAVALMLFGLHNRPGFPLAPNADDEAFDLSAYQRRLAHRLDEVRKSVASEGLGDASSPAEQVEQIG